MTTSTVRTYHGAQGDVVTTLNNTDIILIAQPDSANPSKYRTTNTTLNTVYTILKNEIKLTGSLISVGNGLKGSGLSTDPIQLDTNYFANRWVNKKYVNISQVGATPGAALPITYSGWILKVTAGIKLYLAGISYTMPAYEVSVATIDGVSIAGVDIYLYISVANNIPTWKLSRTPLIDRYDLTYVATVAVSSAGITSIKDAYAFIRLANARIANQKAGVANIRGCSFPVSTGPVYSVGYTSWGTTLYNYFTLNLIQTIGTTYYSFGANVTVFLLANVELELTKLYAYPSSLGLMVLQTWRYDTTLANKLRVTLTTADTNNVPYIQVVTFTLKKSIAKELIYEPTTQAESDLLYQAMVYGRTKQLKLSFEVIS